MAAYEYLGVYEYRDGGSVQFVYKQDGIKLDIMWYKPLTKSIFYDNPMARTKEQLESLIDWMEIAARQIKNNEEASLVQLMITIVSAEISKR